MLTPTQLLFDNGIIDRYLKSKGASHTCRIILDSMYTNYVKNAWNTEIDASTKGDNYYDHIPTHSRHSF